MPCHVMHPGASAVFRLLSLSSRPERRRSLPLRSGGTVATSLAFLESLKFAPLPALPRNFFNVL
jgi:hypothetical protein